MVKYSLVEVAVWDKIKEGVGVLILVGGILLAIGATMYKINSIDGLVAESQAQSQRLAVIEEKTATLEALRSEDLALLRQDIRELKDALERIDNKIQRVVRD